MNDEGLLIEGVADESIAAEMGIEAGDRLIAVNGNPLRDIIDYHYFTADEELLLLVAKRDGELWEVEVDNSTGEPLGIFFPAPLPDCCGNNCIFCFVHQLPKGLRKPLYVKDEDYRLSFLYGNYVTLTNFKPEDLQRIKEQRLSPLYISVHATEPALRETLLGRKGIAPLLPIMEELAAAGIKMHTQIVLCPGVNDGAALAQTISDLAALHPQVVSLAVVPVGLTDHRRRLPSLEPVSKEYAREFIATWQPLQAELQARLGEPFLFFADEFYLKAELPFPDLESYGDLPQLENGVGMIPLFDDEVSFLAEDMQQLGSARITVVTGLSPYSHIAACNALISAGTGLEITTVPVSNLLFGSQVTVTGLVSGGDIASALAGRDAGDVLMVPDVMLKEGEGVFLDDMSLEGLSEKVHCRVESFHASPAGLYQKLAELFS
jgi:putative radical SAM enzyme (TIGR03279 family)